MANSVLIIESDDKGHLVLTVEGGTLTIGDRRANAEVVLRQLHISRIHCEVGIAEDAVVISEPGNVSGSLSGKASLRRELHRGEGLQLGHCRLRLEPAPDEGKEAAAKAAHGLPPVGVTPPPKAAPAPSLLPTPPASASSPSSSARLVRRLMVIDGADQGRSFYLPESGALTVGNSGQIANIVLHDLYVSRVHCELAIGEISVAVKHVQGKNGTLINGQRIEQPRELRVGDILRVGNSHLRLETALADEIPAQAEEETESAASEPASTDYEVVEEAAEAGDVEMAEPVADGPKSSTSGDAARLPHAPVDQLVRLEHQVLGHYQLGALLGRGHFGVMFRAQDLKSKQVVALKVLSPDFPADAAELQQLVQALKVTPQLHHHNLVTLYGAGRSGAHCWIAREFVDGESAMRMVKQLKDPSRLDWARACRVIVHLGRALAYLHQHKIIHGNITLRNILIRGSDKLTKLADLMLMQALGGSRLHQAILERKLLAELPYLAPEQMEPDAFVDHVADLYALGAVAYTLMTGQPPVAGDSPDEVLARIRKGKVVRPTKYQREIPSALEAVVLKLLAGRQEDRYSSAAELLEDVEPFAEEHAIKV